MLLLSMDKTASITANVCLLLPDIAKQGSLNLLCRVEFYERIRKIPYPHTCQKNIFPKRRKKQEFVAAC